MKVYFFFGMKKNLKRCKNCIYAYISNETGSFHFCMLSVTCVCFLINSSPQFSFCFVYNFVCFFLFVLLYNKQKRLIRCKNKGDYYKNRTSKEFKWPDFESNYQKIKEFSCEINGDKSFKLKQCNINKQHPLFRL